jgi:hypothetical protein
MRAGLRSLRLMTVFERLNMPSLGGATGWLNSEPLGPAELRGHVVLVDFWTLTCIPSLLAKLGGLSVNAGWVRQHGRQRPSTDCPDGWLGAWSCGWS